MKLSELMRSRFGSGDECLWNGESIKVCRGAVNGLYRISRLLPDRQRLIKTSNQRFILSGFVGGIFTCGIFTCGIFT